MPHVPAEGWTCLSDGVVGVEMRNLASARASIGEKRKKVVGREGHGVGNYLKDDDSRRRQ